MQLSSQADLATGGAPVAALHTSRCSQLVLIGPGRVGSVLLQQLQGLQSGPGGSAISVIAIVRRSGVRYDPEGLDLDRWEDQNQPLRQLPVEDIPNLFDPACMAEKIIVDATADADIADCYSDWLKQGFHVVTANKAAGSGCRQRYRAIRQSQISGNRHWHYETTVGAGLPVISTVKRMLAAGDRIHRIRGILSGSLSWIVKYLATGKPFTEALDQAHALGLTEPNPLDDISGKDVLRKAIILAREIGLEVSPDRISCQPLVSLPDEVRLPFDASLAKQVNQSIETQISEAVSRGTRVAYLAEISAQEGIKVGLASVDPHCAFDSSLPCDNVIEICSDHYNQNPLVIQGPGAGPQVTASGLLADVLDIHGALIPDSIWQTGAAGGR